MKAVSLQSGSNGNCIYVETKDAKFIFDAGISGKQAQLRLASAGRSILDVDAVFVSHEHSDHIRCAGVYSRKYELDVWITEKTHGVAYRDKKIEKFHRLHHFQSGETVRFQNTLVETIQTPHDGVDGVVFVIDDGQHRLGVMTDLGCVFMELPELVASLDGVFLESNYDVDLLENGPYPYFLKQRIRGDGGHISNREAAELLRVAFAKKLQWACLAHLSEQNNDPAVALRTHRGIVGEHATIGVAGRHRISEIYTL